MQYVIWLEVAALGFNILIWLFYRIQYKKQNAVNKRFEILAFCILMLTATDIASAIGISYHTSVPVWLNYVMNGANYAFAGLSAYAFAYYVRTLVGKLGTPVHKFEKVFIWAYVLAEILNYFFGFFFYFDENGYAHGSLYVVPMLISYAFIVDAALILIFNVKRLTKRTVYGTGSYVALMLISGMVQVLIIPKFLLTGFSSTLTLLIIYLLMETPDYYKLIATMEELEAAKTAANEANEAKSKFLANMSHEIRTPLNTVLGMDEMILRESDDEDILKYARNIKNSGNTLLGIINDILDFSKIESGMMEIVPYEYSLSEAISTVYIMLKQKAADKGLELKLTVDSTLPKKLYGDEKRISQIIINLVNNAIKYTEKGRVELVISRKLLSENDKIQLCIDVKDTGIGIKEKDMAKLFEEFERLDLERNRNVEGTGLGLAICSRLTHAMDGKITVESCYEKGSTFSVELPQKIVDSEPIGHFEIQNRSEESENKPKGIKAPEARVLAVDDNALNLMVLKGLLKQTDIQVYEAMSGKTALEMIKNEKYNIVFLDHMMPEMDGIETLQRAKEINKEAGYYPVYVVLTANAIRGAEDEYRAAGFDDYLSKPIDPKALNAMLIKYLPRALVKNS